MLTRLTRSYKFASPAPLYHDPNALPNQVPKDLALSDAEL